MLPEDRTGLCNWIRGDCIFYMLMCNNACFFFSINGTILLYVVVYFVAINILVMVNHVYSATLLDDIVVCLVFISISQALAGRCLHDAFLFLRTTILGVGSNFASHCWLGVGCGGIESVQNGRIYWTFRANRHHINETVIVFHCQYMCIMMSFWGFFEGVLVFFIFGKPITDL